MICFHIYYKNLEKGWVILIILYKLLDQPYLEG